VKDFHYPPKTVIGEFDQASGDMLAALYKKLEAPLIRTDLETAEMVKYVDNSWHALKIGFANEIGNLCKSLGLDAHKVMNIFVRIASSISLLLTCCRALPSADRACLKIFERFPIRPKCTICNCRFSLPFCRATKCRSLAACNSSQKRGTPGSVFWASVSKRGQTICGEPFD